MPHKNIVIVSHYYPPHPGGIEIVAQNQAERLADLGYRMTVVTSRVPTEEQGIERDRLQVVRVRAWNFFERIGVPFPIFSPRIIRVLSHAIKGADVVHVHDAFYISSWCAVLVAWHYKKPVVLTQHVALISHNNPLITMTERLVYATFGRMVFRRSSRIITLNDRVEQFLLSRGVAKSKIMQLPNGVDSNQFHPASAQQRRLARQAYGVSKGKMVVLFIGRFVPKKGFDQLLKAQDSNYQLVFAGGVAEQKNTEKVRFLGILPHDELPQLYHAADVFIMPSEGEGFPLTVQEAMASGLPIVMTDDEGYARYHLDKESICFLEDIRPTTIQAVLSDLAQNAPKRKRMTTYSTRYARNQFSWGHIVKQLESLYDRVVTTREDVA